MNFFIWLNFENSFQEQDSNEHKRLGSSTSFSIGGARDPRGASKRARAGLSATPRNISNLVPGRPRGSPSKGDTVGQQHHLVALAEYLRFCVFFFFNSNCFFSCLIIVS